MAIKTVEEILAESEVGYVTKGQKDASRTTAVKTAPSGEAAGAGFAGIRAVLDELSDPALTPLQKIVKLRRIAKLSEQSEAPYIGSANVEFAGLKALSPDTKVFAVDGASVKQYTKPSRWDYPEGVKKLEVEFKRAKELSQVDGTAKQQPSTFDQSKDQTFSVTV